MKKILIIITAFVFHQNILAQEGWRISNGDLFGTEFVGWTKVNEDTSTFYWNTKPVERWLGDYGTFQEDVYTFDDYRVTIDTMPLGGLSARLTDLFTQV